MEKDLYTKHEIVPHKRDFWEIINGLGEKEAKERLNNFYAKCQPRKAQTVSILKRNESRALFITSTRFCFDIPKLRDNTQETPKTIPLAELQFQ